MSQPEKPRETFTVTNNSDGSSTELPIYRGQHGPPVVDIRSLHKDLGVCGINTGFKSRASGSRKVTHIDGRGGTLR